MSNQKILASKKVGFVSADFIQTVYSNGTLYSYTVWHFGNIAASNYSFDRAAMVKEAKERFEHYAAHLSGIMFEKN